MLRFLRQHLPVVKVFTRAKVEEAACNNHADAGSIGILRSHPDLINLGVATYSETEDILQLQKALSKEVKMLVT